MSTKLDFELHGLWLPDLSPYFEHYLARRLAAGRLDLSVEARVADMALNVKDRILIEGLRFGKRLSGAKPVVDLPLDFVVALFTDSSGRIDISVPVSGRLDKPGFSISDLVVSALSNIVAKAVSSPFAMLASIAGAGEEIRYVQFEPRKDEINKEAASRLAAVAKIMKKRPALRLVIKGFVDPEKDNGKLSKQEMLKLAARRSHKVAQFLAAEYGIDKKRLICQIPADPFKAPAPGQGGMAASMVELFIE